MPDTIQMFEENHGSSIKPVPDPTLLTTQQLQREISMSRDLLDIKIAGLRESILGKFDALENVIIVLREQISRIRDGVDPAINHLHELQNEKFKSIAIQFDERDTRVDQTSRDSKLAVDAALQAAKEAVGEQNKSNALAIAKSEATYTKQIDQIGLLISALSKAIDDKVDDIKTRVQMMEGSKKGASDFFGLIVGIVGVLVGLGGMIAAMATLFSRR